MSSASLSGNSHFKPTAHFLGRVRGWCALRSLKYAHPQPTKTKSNQSYV
ncbi:hypothetical protein [Rubritalea tangerina]